MTEYSVIFCKIFSYLFEATEFISHKVLLITFFSIEFRKTLRRWFPKPGVPCSKPLGGSRVDSAFHPLEVDKMSTRNFWELSGKK